MAQLRRRRRLWLFLLVGVLLTATFPMSIGSRVNQVAKAQSSAGVVAVRADGVTGEVTFIYGSQGTLITDVEPPFDVDYAPGDGLAFDATLSSIDPDVVVARAETGVVDTYGHGLVLNSFESEFSAGDTLALGDVLTPGDGSFPRGIAEILIGDVADGDIDVYRHGPINRGESTTLVDSIEADFSTGDLIAVGDIFGPNPETLQMDGDFPDGIVEIIVADRALDDLVAYNWNGSQFEIVEFVSDPPAFETFATGNTDGFGADEIVLVDAGGAVQVHRYDKEGGFNLELLSSFSTGYSPGDGFAVADVDGNGIAEVLIADAATSQGEIYRSTVGSESQFSGEPATFALDFAAGDSFAARGIFPDSDGDGLLDHWEQFGLDADGDGDIDVDLPAMGADWQHKDIFIEYDWTPDREPNPESVQMVKDAFAAAPLNNPDGETGINIWFDTGGLTDDGVLVGDDLGNSKTQIPFGICDLDETFYDAKREFFDVMRSLAFRYMVSGNSGCFGGKGEFGGNDILDAYQAGDFVDSDTPEEIRRALALEGGHIMHEIGHTLLLTHGGSADEPIVNCKPNYVSVMSYALGVIERVDGSLIVDYSPPRFPGGRGRAPLDDLHEGALSESTILDSSDPANQFVFSAPDGPDFDSAPDKVLWPLNKAVDWNNDGEFTPDEELPPLSINDSLPGTACPGNDATDETLTGFHDWNNIVIPFRQFGNSVDGALNPVTAPEATIQQTLALQQALHTADLAIGKSASVDSIVTGGQLSYTLTVTNNGTNPISSAQIVDTLPAGMTFVSSDAGCTALEGVVTCNLGYVNGGSSHVVTITVQVDPALTFGGPNVEKLTNTATVEVSATFDNDPNATNNSATSDVTVIVPTELCANRWNGKLRLPSGSCKAEAEELITLPVDGPITACANRWNGQARYSASGICGNAERPVVMEGLDEVPVCINSWNGNLRVSERCSSAERSDLI